MRTLTYNVACSIDGFIAHEDGTWGAFVPEGDHVEDYLAGLARFDAVLMGRRTYEAGLQHGITDPYPQLDSYVFSSTLGASPDPKVQVVPTDAVAFVEKFKQGPGGEIYLCGGGQLAGDLLAAGLIDELALKVNPIVLGSGIPLFGPGTAPVNLRPIERKVYESSVVLERYRVGGSPRS